MVSGGGNEAAVVALNVDVRYGSGGVISVDAAMAVSSPLDCCSVRFFLIKKNASNPARIKQTTTPATMPMIMPHGVSSPLEPPAIGWASVVAPLSSVVVAVVVAIVVGAVVPSAVGVFVPGMAPVIGGDCNVTWALFAYTFMLLRIVFATRVAG